MHSLARPLAHTAALTPRPSPLLGWTLFFTLALLAAPGRANEVRVAALEGGIGEPEAPPVAIGSIRILGRPGHGITFARPDDRFSLTLRGRTQLRHTSDFVAGEAPEHAVAVRTVRLYLQGNTVTPDLRYNVQLAFGAQDFDPVTPSPVFDAFVEYTAFPRARIRAGQFFVPFDRARTNSEFAMQLIDRQQTVLELTLDRDTGVMLYSRDLLGTGGHLGYQVGAFGGEGRNVTRGTTGGFLWAGRLTWRPFGDFNGESEGDLERRATPSMALAVGAAWNRDSTRARGTNGPRYDHARFDHLNLGTDFLLKWRGFSLMAEGLWRSTDARFREREGEDGSLQREWAREGWGYLVQAGQMLTDEVEVSVRWDELWARHDTDPAFVSLAQTHGREAGAGMSWYLNGHRLKLQTDWGVRFGRPDVASDEAVPPTHVVRAALDVSF